MTHQPFPNTDQLRAMYQDIFDNKAVTAISQWTDSNCSDATNEEAYLARAMEIGGAVFDSIKRATEGIGQGNGH